MLQQSKMQSLNILIFCQFYGAFFFKEEWTIITEQDIAIVRKACDAFIFFFHNSGSMGQLITGEKTGKIYIFEKLIYNV